MAKARKAKITVNRMPITKARINLGQVVRKAFNNKEYFILEKDGIPIAGIMNINEFEDYLETKLEQEDAELQAQIKEGHQEYTQGKARTADAFFTSLAEEGT